MRGLKTTVAAGDGTFAGRYAQRLMLVARLFAIQLLVWAGLRLVMVATFRERPTSVRGFAAIAFAGTAYDILAGITALLPLLFLLSAFRLRPFHRPWRQHALVAVAAVLWTFDGFVQYFFFEEYSARYNHLALDYLIYPQEVLGNIFASYDVPLFVALAILLGVALCAATRRLRSSLIMDWRVADRVKALAAFAVLTSVLWLAWTVAPAQVAAGRVTNELALNGWTQLARAYWSAHLDYEGYYTLVPQDEAAARVARVLGPPAVPGELRRRFTAVAQPRGGPLDVVVILEESLGSPFSARFGQQADGEDAVTPELDRWSRDGIALTNVVATGNRTVRGLEGVLCSFPPLPGDSIVKRDRSENVASMARVLAGAGYETSFFYGGYGVFDNLKRFMTANGYQRFVEQPAYPADAFRTIWGVADEFVLDAMIDAQKSANATHRRWFGTALTVSNHKPFKVPPGRVEWPATGKSARRGALLYADWALGHYLSRARDEGLLAHTVVLVVGDHGARVYGAEEIPVTSYRVPAVILTPDPAYRGVVIDRLASQVDLAPTVLSLAGVSYDAPFFGRNLVGLPDAGGRAFVNHNRSVGILTDTALVALGLRQSITAYRRTDRHSDTFSRTTADGPELRELARDSAAVFQTAYQAYRDRRLGLAPSR